MIYLRRFSLPSEGDELAFLAQNRENKRTCYTSRYPFGIFLNRRVPTLELEAVTILCGGNGSGKTTILNLMGERLGLRRGTVFNRSSFFGDYLRMCQVETAAAFERAKGNSRVIASDDVFDYLLDLRCINENIDNRRRELLEEYADARYAKFQMRSMEDVDRLRQVVEAQRHTGSRYVRDRVMNDVVEKSNGESAFAFFTKEIQEDGLYLLDEPEAALSPSRLLTLMGEMDQLVKADSQFVVATHSPILMAFPRARIYELSEQGVGTVEYRETEHYQLTKRFLDDPERMLRYLLEE